MPEKNEYKIIDQDDLKRIVHVKSQIENGEEITINHSFYVERKSFDCMGNEKWEALSGLKNYEERPEVTDDVLVNFGKLYLRRFIETERIRELKEKKEREENIKTEREKE